MTMCMSEMSDSFFKLNQLPRNVLIDFVGKYTELAIISNNSSLIIVHFNFNSDI